MTSSLVSTLTGARQVDLAIRCLSSLQAFSEEPVAFRIYDDATLKPPDLSRLTSALNVHSIVSSAEADDLCAPALRSRPSLSRARSGNPLMRKLVDVVVGGLHDQLAFIDTDILFFRRFSGLFKFPGEQVGAVLMSDVANAYSVRSWHLPGFHLELPQRANSGIILFRTQHWDADYLEWFFRQEEFSFCPAWIEQTAWALLAWRAGCWLYDEKQICVVTARGALPGDRVGAHFVSTYRHRLEELDQTSPSQDHDPVQICSAPARRLGPIGMAGAEAARRLSRLAGAKPLL